LRYRIVATEANNVRTDLIEPYGMVMLRNSAGYDIWFGTVTRGDGPTSRYGREPPPSVVVEVSSERYQRVEAVVAALPRPDQPLQLALEPGWAYEFPSATGVPGSTGPTLLRGTLRRPNGMGVAGARVRANPPVPNQTVPGPEYVTDDTGGWVLPFDDAVATTAAAQVEITLAGSPPIQVAEVTITQGDSSTLRHASLTGIARRTSGATLPGVVITADTAPGLVTTSDADGKWELWLPVEQFLPSAGPQPVAVTATPPGGAAIVRNSQIQPRATARLAPFVFP
jgi:hypothetical protein